MPVNRENTLFRYPLLSKILIITAGVLAGFLVSRVFLVSFTVTDDSMVPALRRGETVYVLKHVEPAEGDIVLIESPVEPGRVLLKRVIASGGDTVEIRNKVIYKNNRKVGFSWKTLSTDNRIFPMSFSQRDNLQAVRIERNMVFVLGDNLDYSFDSRVFGPVGRRAIIGKVVYKL